MGKRAQALLPRQGLGLGRLPPGDRKAWLAIPPLPAPSPPPLFSSADLEKAAEAATLSSYRNAGQTCICTNRVFVQVSQVW